jgi:hypothetical protein
MAREEGVYLRCDLILLDPGNSDPEPPERIAEQRWQCVTFDQPLPLTVPNLSKLATAADPWTTAVAIHVSATDAPTIWAFVDQQIHYNRWRYHDAEFGPSNPAAYRIALEDVGHISVYFGYDALVRIVGQQVLFRPLPVFWLGPVSQLLTNWVATFVSELKLQAGNEGFEAQDFWPVSVRREFIRALERILLHISKYHHGGALLIAPGDGEHLKPRYAMPYGRLWTALLKQMRGTMLWHAAFDVVAESDPIPTAAYRAQRAGDRLMREASLEVDGCVHFLGSLSRVDGVVWLDERLALRGFGVEISGMADPQRVAAASDPEASAKGLIVRNPSEFGMRHRSVMRYCYAHPQALGFVISQDGPVRAIARVGEDLVFWENIRIREE